MKYISSKIKDFGKKALYKIGKTLSYITPFVPGDLQMKIAEHDTDLENFNSRTEYINSYKGLPEDCYAARRTAINYTNNSAVIELGEIILPLELAYSPDWLTSLVPLLDVFDVLENIDMKMLVAGGAYLAADFYYRCLSQTDILTGGPRATMAIEVPYQIGKLGYKRIKNRFTKK